MPPLFCLLKLRGELLLLHTPITHPFGRILAALTDTRTIYQFSGNTSEHVGTYSNGIKFRDQEESLEILYKKHGM
jgi:hypothetical protein